MAVLQSSAQRLVGCAIAWIVIGSAAVLLRLVAKQRIRTAFSLDDAWCLCALILITVFNALQIAGKSAFIAQQLLADIEHTAVVTAGGSLIETEMTIPQLTGYLKVRHLRSYA